MPSDWKSDGGTTVPPFFRGFGLWNWESSRQNRDALWLKDGAFMLFGEDTADCIEGDGEIFVGEFHSAF